MKRIFLLFCFSMSFFSLLSPFSSLLSHSLSAQVPHHFNYQAILRGNNGEPLANQNVNIRISLLLDSDIGPVSYQEIHQQTTNVFGLVNLAIGSGTVIAGVFDTLSWSSQSYYIKVEADPAGGTDFTDMGTVQLLAVPYAMHAEDATWASASPMIRDSDGETAITTELTPDDNNIRFYTGGLERLRLTGMRLEMPNNSGNILFGDRSGEAITSGSANVFIGDSAGARNTEGSINTFLGTWSGASNTTGNSNTFVGFLSGSKNTSGNSNTFIGMLSGRWNTTGYVNTFIGMFSGRNNTTGNNNTFIGYESGHENTTGERNAFLGSISGHNNQTGSGNVYIGDAAGFNNQAGEGNVFIGTDAGFDEMGSNRLYISNRSYDPLISGEFDNEILRFRARRIEVINNNGNTILGANAGFKTNGGGNVYIGLQAAILDSLGNYNVYIGLDAGYNNSTGSYNVFLGHRAGVSNTTGERNTFVGTDAGLFTTTGMQNTFVGIESGRGNRTGNNNTYLGMGAGYDNESGSLNVFIGNYAGRNETASNRLYIANSETSEPLIYGEFDNSLLKFHGQVDVVDHDVYINDATKGIILASPGGQCYRITVADDGTLVTNAVDCP